VESNLSYLRFANASSQSVSLVPQPRISTTIRYQVDFGQKWKLSSIECIHSANFQQIQVATFEKPSKFYQVCHASIHVQHQGPHFMDIELSAKNLFNANYIDHLSRLKNIQMPSQGRSFILSFKWKIASD
jgi:outer membrane receptor for monomeric catechols